MYFYLSINEDSILHVHVYSILLTTSHHHIFLYLALSQVMQPLLYQRSTRSLERTLKKLPVSLLI